MQLWPRGRLWRHPDFLRLWSAKTISQLGSQVTFLALPLAAILVLVGLANFFGNVMFSIFLVYAVRDLGLTAATIGLIGSLGNVGLL
ncbi:MAG: hypothetical protein H0U05_09380, partial [Actinobacteria bacterium]|nr:hypothetical protein [Actinomycetota bacterium]